MTRSQPGTMSNMARHGRAALTFFIIFVTCFVTVSCEAVNDGETNGEHPNDHGTALGRVSTNRSKDILNVLVFYHHGSRTIRLVVTIALLISSLLLNIIFISSFYIEKTLHKGRFAYLACTSVAELLASVVPLTAACVKLASGLDPDTSSSLCRTLHFVLQMATYSYHMCFFFVAVESFYRICSTTVTYHWFLSLPPEQVLTIVLVLSLILCIQGTYHELDYCSLYYKESREIFIIFHLVAFFITIFLLSIACYRMKIRAKNQDSYRRSKQYQEDYAMNIVNIVAYLMFVSSWLPYLWITFMNPDAKKWHYYVAIWLGVGRTIFSSAIYFLGNSTFRHSFCLIFKYCWCKRTFPRPLQRRHHRAADQLPSMEEMYSAHIMQMAIKASEEQHQALASSETHNL